MAAAQTGSAIGVKIRVDQQSPFDLELFAKVLCEFSVSIPNDDDFDSLATPGLHRVTQLRDLLTTKESTEMPQKEQDDSTGLPQIAETDGQIGRGIDQGDRREAGRATQSVFLLGRATTTLAGDSLGLFEMRLGLCDRPSGSANLVAESGVCDFGQREGAFLDGPASEFRTTEFCNHDVDLMSRTRHQRALWQLRDDSRLEATTELDRRW
jgi:hypothetical protein